MYPNREMWSIFALLWFQRNLILLFSRYKTLCKIQKNMWIPFILLGSCLLGKWMVFSWLLPSRIWGFHSNYGTRLLYCKMQKVFCLRRASNGPLGHFLWFKMFALITALQKYDKLKKRIPSQVLFKDFVHGYRTAF